MTRQDVLSTLRQLVTGRLRQVPPSWHVEEAEGRLVIAADGDRFDVEVRPSTWDHDPMDEILGEMTEEGRAAFFRDLEEAADEAERDGPVPAHELRRDLDEAIERGLLTWNARPAAPPEGTA